MSSAMDGGKTHLSGRGGCLHHHRDGHDMSHMRMANILGPLGAGKDEIETKNFKVFYSLQ